MLAIYQRCTESYEIIIKNKQHGHGLAHRHGHAAWTWPPGQAAWIGHAAFCSQTADDDCPLSNENSKGFPKKFKGTVQ